MQPFFVYILHCGDGAYYVGHTDNLEFRVSQHVDGTCPGYVSARLPVELVYAAELPSRDDALMRERQIKTWSRAKKQALIAGDWARLKQLAIGRDR